MTRLDTQRVPSKVHTRPNKRWAVRGYDITPHEVWGESFSVSGPARTNAAPTTVYPADPNITASDAPNAAKLSGLGYYAVPQTNWTTGQKITVGTYDFNWTGSAWAAGTHA